MNVGNGRIGGMGLAAAVLPLLLAACSSSPTPPPEPNMKKLVDVNKTYPAELYRADAANNGE